MTSYEMKYPTISDHPGIQSVYVEMRRAGESHNIAEMLAIRITPGLSGTERSFFQGHCNGNQFADETARPGCRTIGQRIKDKAKAAGVDTTGAVYLGGLADSPGDPKAWVKDTGDVRRVLKERNWSSQGAINVKAREVEPAPGIAVADDLVNREVAYELSQNPEKASKIATLREEIKERITPEWKKK